jgi:magnesium transporter
VTALETPRASSPSVTLHVLDASGYAKKSELAEVPSILASGAKLWIDTVGEEAELGRFLQDVLGLHPMLVEDLLEDRPAPKVEDYGSSLYIVAHGVALKNDEVCSIEVDMVLTGQWILTHRLGPSSAVDDLAAELPRKPQALARGPAFVAHAILDRLVDSYLPIVDAWDDEIDRIEVAVVERPSPEVVQQIFKLKRALQSLRRGAVHQRELLTRLSRGEFALVSGDALPFYRDVYDHFLRVTDLGDSYREILSGALDIYLSTVSNRMNEVMKTLTLVATILLPMTFMAGVWGMNFDFMPELHWQYGYPLAWILMLGIGIGMVVWFKTRRWL